VIYSTQHVICNTTMTFIKKIENHIGCNIQYKFMYIRSIMFKFDQFVYVPIAKSDDPKRRVPTVKWKFLAKTPNESSFIGKNISVKCGRVSNIVVVDIDNRGNEGK
jgi:hypothetical protein